jgi:hypothetical protein
MNKIAAVVVTYNRKKCLAECLSAIRRQSMIPDIIYVVDNHSTDGTPTWMFEQQYISEILHTNNVEDIILVSHVPSLNLSSYCSFEMTDIWWSFVVQRVAWICGWSVLFHSCTNSVWKIVK